MTVYTTRFSATRYGRLARWSPRRFGGFGLGGGQPHRLLRGRELGPQEQLVDDFLPDVLARGDPSPPTHGRCQLRALLEYVELPHQLDRVVGLEDERVSERLRIVLAG